MQVKITEKIKEIKPNKFWSKIDINFEKIGREVLHKALLLFYAMYDDNVPYWARGVVVGALSYFLIPFDAMPDVIPIAGYADDLAVLGFALTQMYIYISDETKLKAETKLEEILGKFTEEKEKFEHTLDKVKDTIDDVKEKAGQVSDTVKEMAATKTIEEKKNIEVVKEVKS